MNAEKFSEALGNVRDEYVSEANTYKRASRSLGWVKWGAAAACLCLVAAGSGVLISRNYNKPVTSYNESDITAISGDKGGVTGGGTGIQPGGVTIGESDDMMGGSFSVAVFPPSEKRENVASAKVDSLTESELSGMELAQHLPKQLPDGFHFGRGSLYTTVMKDGTEYNMLRIEYINGTIQEQKFSEDGGAIAPEVWTEGDNFCILVHNYEPDTYNIYAPSPDEKPVSVTEKIHSSAEEITLEYLNQHRVAYIRTGDCCVSVGCGTAEHEDVLKAVKSIE